MLCRIRGVRSLMKYTLAFTLVTLLVRFGIALSAQQPGQGPIRASLERETTRLASTLVTDNQPVGNTAGLHKAATQMGRLDDWSAVRQLGDGTRVVISTAQNQRIRGRISAFGDGTLQMVDREGNDR